jgi:hypothetical protein
MDTSESLISKVRSEFSDDRVHCAYKGIQTIIKEQHSHNAYDLLKDVALLFRTEEVFKNRSTMILPNIKLDIITEIISNLDNYIEFQSKPHNNSVELREFAITMKFLFDVTKQIKRELRKQLGKQKAWNYIKKLNINTRIKKASSLKGELFVLYTTAEFLENTEWENISKN